MTPMRAMGLSKPEATKPGDGATVSEVPELPMRFDDPMRIISVTLTPKATDIAVERQTGMEPAEEFRRCRRRRLRREATITSVTTPPVNL